MDFQTPSENPAREGAARQRLKWLAAICLALPLAVFSGTFSASALSEIQREELPAPQDSFPSDETPEKTVPIPDPIQPPAVTAPEAPGQSPADGTEDGVARPDAPEEPLPEIIYDLERLPPDVRRMRELLVEAAKSGDLERLRPLIGLGDDVTQLSLGGLDGDPIAFLKGLSGDSEGREILAIMEEVLSAGYVHLDAGTDAELYVWPYFFGIPLDKLDARQHVELFKIVTAGDYEDMKNLGSYVFYRLGITPEGRWAFFVAGE
ncbi:MAG: hypothetical protein H0T56_16865 [Pseudaminobacter sp.]|nr:hypothetical protein [Pseudaminobacter sp.]